MRPAARHARTVARVQMLRDRGYLVGQKDLNTTLEEFRATFGDHPDRALLSIQTSLLSNEEEQARAPAAPARTNSCHECLRGAW